MAPGNKLSEDAKQAIRDLRRSGASQQVTADTVGCSKSTVKKYDVEEAIDPDMKWRADALDPADIFSDGVDWEAAIPDENIPDRWRDTSSDGGNADTDTETDDDEDISAMDPDEWTGPKPGESPLSSDAESKYRLADDYQEIDPGEFTEQFFDDFDVGVRSKFVRMVARRANRKKKLPDKDKMKSLLQQHSSGIGNANDAEFVAEEWWEEAQNYIAETDATAYGTGGGQQNTPGDSGSYVGVNNGNGQGRWIDLPGQGMQYGRMEQQPDGSVRFVPMQPPQQPGAMGQQPPAGGQPGMYGQQQQGGLSDREKEMMDMMRELVEDQKSGSAEKDPMDAAMDMIERAEKMKEMTGGGSDDEVKQYIQQLQQQFQQVMSQQNQPMPDNPKDQAVQRIMQDDSISADKAFELIEKMESKTGDPEVEKARIERDAEIKKMEQKKDRVESVVDGLENLFQQIGAGIGQGIAAQDGQQAQQQTQQQAQQQAQQQPPRQQPPQQPPQQPQQPTNGTGPSGQNPSPDLDIGDDGLWECPECGAETAQDPSVPGAECGECDYTVMPCPACYDAVEVPPAEERSKRACPSCGLPVDTDTAADGSIACMECSWVGETTDLGPDVVACDSCGQVHELIHPAPEP